MSITSFKITDSDISSKGVVAAPTVLSGSPEENKRIFDRLVREVLKGDFNALVDALAATTGAGEIGAAVEGLTGETVQAILSALKTLLDSKAASADMEAALGGKSDTSVTDTHIKSVAFDAGTGVFTFTKENGTTVTVDTALEKVAVNFAYDEDTQSLVLTLADGSTQHVSLAAFLTTTEFEDSNTIEWSVSGSKVRATIKSGSITDAMLSSTLKTMLQGYVSAAANSATNAADSEARSLGYQNAARAAAKEAEASQQEAKADADRAASASAHQPRISSDGYWELWDLTQGVYVKTTYQANGADGDPGIVISATQPTAESHPVWINPEGEASPAGGTDLSLGITGATVGQIAKITAVDDTGKPTAWEAADMPSGVGETWEKISDVSLTQDVSRYILASFGTYRKIKIMMERDAYVSELSKNVWVRIYLPNGTSAFYNVGYLTGDYGYVKWEATVEVNNAFISGHLISTNNPNATVTPKRQASKELGDIVASDLSLHLEFTDVSVIQEADSVSVWGVRW